MEVRKAVIPAAWGYQVSFDSPAPLIYNLL